MTDRVDGGDDGRGRDEGRRYFLLIFLLVTSYFSLSFDFSPLSFLFLFYFFYFFIYYFLKFHRTRIRL